MDLQSEILKTIENTLSPYSIGTGIVIVGGRDNYFINAYLNIRLLRKLGCSLPVELYYIPSEFNQKYADAVAQLDNVNFIQINGLPELTDSFAREGGGWQAKMFALAQSSFEHVLFVDADCFSVVDPIFLFNTEEYKKFGVIMWYDGFAWELYEPWFQRDYLKLKETFPKMNYESARTIELGQLVINKGKLLNSVLFAREFNRWWHRTYPWSLGDKESMLLGCLVFDHQYYVVPRFPDIIDDAFVHYSPDTLTHLFSHCFRCKWDKMARCKTSSRILPHGKEMEEWCRELVVKIP